MQLYSGQIVKTLGGRNTSPFPKIDLETNRKAIATTKRVDKWLYDNAVEEAIFRKNDFVLNQFKCENPVKMPPATKDSMHLYLFGDIF